MKTALTGKATDWIILTGLAFVWGSSFILMKRGLEFFSPTQVASLRISIASLSLLYFAVRNIRKVDLKLFFLIALSGLIGSGIPAFLFAYAQTGLDSSVAGILNSLTPLFTLLIGLSFFRMKAGWLKVSGVLIGLAGAAGLLSVSGNGDMEFNFRFGIWVVAATALYALNLNYIKTFIHRVDIITLTSISFLPIGLLFAIYLFVFSDVQQAFAAADAWQGLGYIAILAVVGTALSMILFNRLLHRTNPVFSSMVTYMIPVFALLWGIADHEPFHLTYFLWIALILTGVFLSNRPASSDTLK